MVVNGLDAPDRKISPRRRGRRPGEPEGVGSESATLGAARFRSYLILRPPSSSALSVAFLNGLGIVHLTPVLAHGLYFRQA